MTSTTSKFRRGARLPRNGARLLRFEQCEPRHLLTAVVEIGDVNNGIAVADDAVGSGYVMYTELATQPRFCLELEHADHLVAVRFENDVWQYNDDVDWTNFEPAATDRLLAQIDFDVDVVRGYEGTLNDGTVRPIGGIEMGYSDGDLNFFANQWAGVEDEGEIDVTGTQFTLPSNEPPPVAVAAERLGLALLNFESATNRFPAHAIYSDQGVPNLSWRVSILPYLGYQSLYERFRVDEAWDSPHNLTLLGEMPDVFDNSARDTPDDHTVYQVLNGPDTMFPSSPEGLRYYDAVDGWQNTILLVEADSDAAVPWTKPEDIRFDPSQPNLNRPQEENHLIVLVDGETLTVSPSLDLDIWRRLASRDDGEPIATSLIFPAYDVETSLQRITLANLNHESALSRFPVRARLAADGTPLLSWRVSVLPYLGYSALYEQFNLTESWDSPHNLALLPYMPREFATAESFSEYATNYLAATGEGTAFPVPKGVAPGRGAKFGELANGAKTVLIVESDPALAVEWTKPVDLEYTPDGELPGAGDPDASEFRVSLADNTILSVPTGIPPADWVRSSADVFESAPHNLNALSTAALNHFFATNRFPSHALYSDTDPAQPLLSWRVAILPFLGYSQIYEQFALDEAWDSPHNLALLPQMPQIYAHPQVSGFRTNYLAMTGQGTAFPIANAGANDLEDGYSRTLLYVEADVDQAVEWTRPADIVFDAADPLAGLGNIVESAFRVSFADGSVRTLSADASPSQFTAAVFRSDESDLPINRRQGDVNLDGAVDSLDFDIIRGSLFDPPALFHTWQTGDLNDDKIVDVSDFNIWLVNQDI